MVMENISEDDDSFISGSNRSTAQKIP